MPERFQGSFRFDRESSVAYWQTKTNWPSEMRDQLVEHALPTIFIVEAKVVTAIDVATGEKVTRSVEVEEVEPTVMKIKMANNFAPEGTLVTFEFDEEGFWMTERSLFPDYKERFQRTGNP